MAGSRIVLGKRVDYRGWGAEENEEIRRRWVAGESQAQLAAHFHVTRNTIAGKIDRLGLRGLSPNPKPAEAKPSVRHNMIKFKKEPAIKFAKGPKRRARRPGDHTPEITAEQVSRISEGVPSPDKVGELRSAQCRWIHDVDNIPAYCANDKLEGFSYCGPHARAAYRAR